MQTSVNLEPKQYAIIVLTLITAVIHLTLNFPDTLFILNGLGYLALLGALYLPLEFLVGYRSVVRWALLIFAVVTIIAYFVVNPAPFQNTLGLIDKAVEVVLVVLLLTEVRS